jgi:8-oxo-dGTP diphosphatase
MKQSYVVGFLFDPLAFHVALIRKARPAWQRGYLNGIGGKVESRECPRDAMAREFEEETGAKVIDWKFFARMYGDDWEVFCYKSFGDYILSTKTDEEIVTVFLEDLENHKLIPNLNWLIPLALDPDKPTATVHVILNETT